MRTLRIPGIVLMENAARGCADLALRMLPRTGLPRVVIACGPGQNGGDGYAIARHLHLAGCAVQLHALGAPDPASDAGVMRAICEAMHHAIEPFGERLPACDLVIDALFGIGLDRPLQADALHAVRAVNDAGRPVLSVDLPSGMDADTGMPMPECVRAMRTATMVAPKAGFAAPGAAAWLGGVEIVGIGGPPPVDHG